MLTQPQVKSTQHPSQSSTFSWPNMAPKELRNSFSQLRFNQTHSYELYSPLLSVQHSLPEKKHPCSQKIAAFQSELAREDKQPCFVSAVVGNNEQSTFYLKPAYKNLKIFMFSLLILDSIYLEFKIEPIYSIQLGINSSKIT